MTDFGREWSERVDHALKAAFPSGVTDREVDCILAVLVEHLSLRESAGLLQLLVEKDHGELYWRATVHTTGDAFVDMNLYAEVHQKLSDTGLLQLLQARTDAANEFERQEAAASEARWNLRVRDDA